MGTIMIRCPQTGREIQTGVEMSAGDFSRAPVFFSRVLCPLCHCEHEWFAKDAWVCEVEDSEDDLEDANTSNPPRAQKRFA